MSRRHRQPQDSLEMLLDTMCNTFGGIILIALLVSLLARDLKPVNASPSPPPSRQQEALQNAKQIEVELARRISDPNQTNLIARIQEREQFTREIEALKQRIAATAATADPALLRSNEQARVNELTRRNEQILLEIAEAARAEQARETRIREIEHEKESQVRQMRLPRETNEIRSAWFIVARHGRLYPLRVLPRAANTEMVDYEKQGDFEFFKPKPDRGIDPRTQAAAFKSLLQALPRDKYFVTFLVYGDSYPAFSDGRRIALDLGHSYGLRLVPNSIERIDLGAGGESIGSQ